MHHPHHLPRTRHHVQISWHPLVDIAFDSLLFVLCVYRVSVQLYPFTTSARATVGHNPVWHHLYIYNIL